METVVVSAYWDVSVVGGSIFRVGLIGHVSVIEGATGDTSTGQIRGDLCDIWTLDFNFVFSLMQ